MQGRITCLCLTAVSHKHREPYVLLCHPYYWLRPDQPVTCCNPAACHGMQGGYVYLKALGGSVTCTHSDDATSPARTTTISFWSTATTTKSGVTVSAGTYASYIGFNKFTFTNGALCANGVKTNVEIELVCGSITPICTIFSGTSTCNYRGYYTSPLFCSECGN